MRKIVYINCLVGALLGLLVPGAHAALLLGAVLTQPTVDCLARPGDIVAIMLSSGPQYTLEGSTSFAVDADRVVVAPGGIAAADCGNAVQVTVTARVVKMSPRLLFTIMVAPPQ